MAKKKKAIKAAEKALVAARSAVSDAEKAVGKLDKKTRRRAAALRIELRAAEKTARTALKRDEKTGAKRREAHAQSQSVRAVARQVASTEPPAERAPKKAPASEPAGITYRELREQAKAKGIPGYSRMNKADLAAALVAS